MNTKNSLTLGMGLLFLFVFLFFGIIIINEKKEIIMLPKVEEKLNEYINNNYRDISSEINISKVKYKNNYFYVKVSNKENSNLYFLVKYKNKKITNTYKKDYLEGKSIITYLEKKLVKSIKKSKDYKDISISFNKNLNQYSDEVRENILKEKKVSELSVYSIKSNTFVDEFSSNNLILSIKNFYTYINNNNLNPKYYSLIITNSNDITQAVEITGLDKKIIHYSLNEVINAIINNDESIMNKYNITYKYLN